MLLFLLPLMLFAPLAGRLYDRYGAKLPAVTGLTLATLGLFWQTQVLPRADFLLMFPALIVTGAGMGLFLSQAYTDGTARVGRTGAGVPSVPSTRCVSSAAPSAWRLSDVVAGNGAGPRARYRGRRRRPRGRPARSSKASWSRPSMQGGGGAGAARPVAGGRLRLRLSAARALATAITSVPAWWRSACWPLAC